MKRALVLWVLFASCSAHQPRDGDILTIGVAADLGEIDPIRTSAGGGSLIMDAMYDGLVKNDGSFGIRPGLAERWEVSGDGKTWRFFLRHGVRFHDGHTLTSEDVKFTMDRILDSETRSPYASALEDVMGVEEKGAFEIEIRTREPNYPFIHFCDFSVVPRYIYEEKKSSGVVPGTGPFTLARRDEKEIFLTANKDYFLGRPHLDGIRVKTYRTQTEAWAHLMSGDIDILHPVLPRNYSFVASLPDIELYSSLEPYYYILGFNMKEGIFKDKNLRLALGLAIDRQALVREVLQGRGRECSGPLFPGTIGYDHGGPVVPYDPEKAIELLKASGWVPGAEGVLRRRGHPLRFTCVVLEGDEILRETGLMIQEQLSRIGIHMDLKVLSLQEFMKKVWGKRYQCAISFSASLFDPDFQFRFLHSSQSMKGFNWYSYKNPVVDELLEKGRMENDHEKRERIYSLFQREVQADPPGAYLFWREYLAGVHKRFRGVKMGPGGLLWNVGEWWVPEKEQKHYRDTPLLNSPLYEGGNGGMSN